MADDRPFRSFAMARRVRKRDRHGQRVADRPADRDRSPSPQPAQCPVPTALSGISQIVPATDHVSDMTVNRPASTKRQSLRCKAERDAESFPRAQPAPLEFERPFVPPVPPQGQRIPLVDAVLVVSVTQRDSQIIGSTAQRDAEPWVIAAIKAERHRVNAGRILLNTYLVPEIAPDIVGRAAAADPDGLRRRHAPRLTPLAPGRSLQDAGDLSAGRMNRLIRSPRSWTFFVLRPPVMTTTVRSSGKT